MIRALLTRLTRSLTPRVIFDREGRSPYLSRYYLVGRPTMADGSDPIISQGQLHKDAIFPKHGYGLYLHRFHRSDSDQQLHSHPWEWAYALILAGGYCEERREDQRVVHRERLPGSFVRLRADDFHRVDLLEDDSWSLFFAGPKIASWGFWDRVTGDYLPWRAFIASVRGPAWDDPETGRLYKCGELTAMAKTAFAAREWFAQKLGVSKHTLHVELVGDEKRDAQTAATDAMSRGRNQARKQVRA